MKIHDLEKENIFKLFFDYAIPAMIGIGVFSLYSFVDAVFVSNACGESALAAVEICAPVLSVFSCFSVIIGVGGNTLVGIELGKKENNKACEIFSLASFLIIILSLIFSVLLVAFTRPVAYLLGADESVVDYVCDYLSLCGWFAPFYMLSGFWGLSSETAGKPAFAMLGNVAMALGNIALDYIFIIVLKLGVFGASLASGISALLATLIFLIGITGKSSVLKFTKFRFDFSVIKQMLFNGFSDGLTAASGGIISFIYNTIIMNNGGGEALACYTVTLTVVNFIGSVIIGAAQGINPIVSVNFGAKRHDRIKKAVRIFLGSETVIAIITAIIFIALHSDILELFGSENGELSWTISKAYVPVFLLTPWCAIIISVFTAINDAKTSAILSLLRSLVIRTVIVIAAYYVFGLNGVWYSCVVSEFISVIICLAALSKKWRSEWNAFEV